MSVSVRRVVRTAAAALGVGVGVAVVGVVLAGPASAHVTVHADSPVEGGSDVAVSFRVPNEQDSATVTKLQVALPTDHPLLGVLVRPHPGWTSAVKQVTLNPPVKTDDGTITQAVSEITWTASNATAAIPVGGYDDFTIDAGKLPDGQTSLVFKAIQTYSNGQTTAWIEQAASGQAEPEHPAPVLSLSPANSAPAPGSVSSSATPTTATAPTTEPAAATSGSQSDTTARVLAILAIALALLVGGGGYLLGRRGPP